ncbi:MFS transporter [Acidithiobacillus sp. IBUN Pt1247-S3]|uniref:MFS transporter n=1 Tax=Acidithiobacillus sp. IBUN Pt1247-S3 TaxID=3166642 RepID=UPI0034E3AC9A
MNTSSYPQADDAGQNQRPTLVAIILVIFLAAIDGTVMSTLLPTIADALGDRDLYPWIMSGFFLPLALIAPLSGALADRFGALRVLVFGIVLFLTASIAAAISPSLPCLIAARVAQGAGAGVIIVLSYTLLAILYGPDQRGRMQGLLSGVWGLAAIFGPLLGASLSITLGWRWVFWINLPIGLVAMILLIRTKLPAKRATRATIAPVIQMLLAVAVCGVLITLTAAGQHGAKLIELVAGVCGILAFLALLWKIRQSPKQSPVPVQFFQRKDLGAAIILILLGSAGLYASVTLLPFSLHAQGRSALHIGLYIMVAALGWVMGSTLCGLSLKRYGYRMPSFLGAVILAVGTAGLGLAATTGNVVFVAGSECLLGLGVGLLATATLVLSQNAAPKAHVGSYTSTVQLFRNLGAAFGVNAIAVIQFHSSARAGSFALSFSLLAILMALSIPLSLLLPRNYALIADQRASYPPSSE